MGAAGRDFHNFLTCYRDNPHYKVIAFTAAQIPLIAERKFPRELAGARYPQGIPIFPEEDLPELIRRYGVDTVAFSYSDLSHTEVMHRAAVTTSQGADFVLIGSRQTMLSSKKPVVSVCGVRTGCGKSQTTRKVSQILRKFGKKIVVVRHPMPYGDLKKQVVQRFAAQEDFARHQCTIEEMEEYESLVDQGVVVYAGVDYAEILNRSIRRRKLQPCLLSPEKPARAIGSWLHHHDQSPLSKKERSRYLLTWILSSSAVVAEVSRLSGREENFRGWMRWSIKIRSAPGLPRSWGLS